MAFKLVLLAAFLAAANASGIAAPVALAKTVVAEPYDPNPQYSYGYEVQDPLTGDSHGQVETRSGDVVRGSYALLDSDGTRRQVDYSADPINGFNAVVSKQPVVAAVARVAAPVVPAAPLVRAAPVLPAAPIAAAPLVRAAPVLPAAPYAPYAATSVVSSAPVLPAAPLVRSAAYLPGAPFAAAPLVRSAAIAAPYATSTLVSGVAAPFAAAPLATPVVSSTIVRSGGVVTAPVGSASVYGALPLAPALRAAPWATGAVVRANAW